MARTLVPAAAYDELYAWFASGEAPRHITERTDRAGVVIGLIAAGHHAAADWVTQAWEAYVNGLVGGFWPDDAPPEGAQQ